MGLFHADTPRKIYPPRFLTSQSLSTPPITKYPAHNFHNAYPNSVYKKAPALPFGASAILKQLPSTPSTKVPICKPYNSSLSCHSFNISPLPNKPIGRARSHSHYRNHPRLADPSPQFDDPPIFGPGLGDFCDPPTTITVTVPGPAVTGGAQPEPVTLTVTITAEGVDTGLLDGIFGPINIGQSVKPEKAITIATTRTSAVAPPESTETATTRVTGSEVTATGETSEVTITVSAKNAEGVPSTITAHPTSTVAVGDAANAGNLWQHLAEIEKTKPPNPGEKISQRLLFHLSLHTEASSTLAA